MSIYDYVIVDRNGSDVSLKNYKGKVLIIVNTATGCGFTPQYEGLEKLYKEYHEKGLEVIDIPCNQFGNQAPGTDDEIHEFCALKYNTSFDQFTKADVNGENELSLYTYLKGQIKEDKIDGIKNKMAMKAVEKISKTIKKEGDIEIIFFINEKRYKYLIPAQTKWEKGIKYSYDFLFDGHKITLHQAESNKW